jgi:hypothetical protein
MKLCRNYLSARGITDETVRVHGLELDDLLSATIIKSRLGRRLPKSVNELIWFPLPDAQRTVCSYIARILPDVNVNGQKFKFLCPKGSDGPPYIPKPVFGLKAGRPLVITEGPIKGLACVQAGLDAIGLNGVFGAGWQPTPQDKYRLRPDLAGALDWRGRKVYLAFDADASIKADVRHAMFRLFFLLSVVGAEVYQLTTWDVAHGNGIDDYLVDQLQSNGQCPPADVLKRLVSGAKPFIETVRKTSLDLGLVRSELTKVDLPDLLRHQLCRALGHQLGVPGEDLRAVVSQPAGVIGPVFASDPDPWPDSVAGEALLHDLTGFTMRHVVTDDHSAVAVALYTVLTYLTDVVDVLPLLVILSPTKRCGKTRLLGVLARSVRRAMGCISITPATLYRSIEKWHPTLLIDEADNLLKDSKGNDNAELRSVINAGHTRDFAFVPRCAGDTHEVEGFSTWAPKVIALVGKLPDSIFDRSIPVHLRRRSKNEPVKPLRDTQASEWLELRQKLLRFAADNGDAIGRTKPALPQGMNDRAEDNWIPLLAIAEAAGGDWPNLAAKAALELSKGAEDQESIVTQLLMAISKIYQDAGMTGPSDFLSSSFIVTELNKDQEAPWRDFRKGMGISITKVASILRPFGLKSEQRQINNVRACGYPFGKLKPIFDRYI